LTWKWQGINGIVAEQVFKTCADVQMKRNILNQVMTEINKVKIIKPNGINLQGIK